jgi:hypothetical protein
MNSGLSPNLSQGPLLVSLQQYPLKPEVKEGLIPIIKDLDIGTAKKMLQPI